MPSGYAGFAVCRWKGDPKVTQNVNISGSIGAASYPAFCRVPLDGDGRYHYAYDEFDIMTYNLSTYNPKPPSLHMKAGYSLDTATPFRLVTSANSRMGANDNSSWFNVRSETGTDGTLNAWLTNDDAEIGWLVNTTVREDAVEVKFVATAARNDWYHMQDPNGNVVSYCVAGCENGGWLYLGNSEDLPATVILEPLALQLLPLTVATPTLTDCLFMNNYAPNAGGIGLQNVAAEFKNCEWRHNTGSVGGGMLIYDRDKGVTKDPVFPTFIDCQIVGNTVTGDGAGVAVYDRGEPYFLRTAFVGNVARGWGGGGRLNDLKWWNRPTFEDCTFEYNIAGLKVTSPADGGGAGSQSK